MVVSRAIIRDLAEGHEAARMMAQLILVMGAAPILAPTLGGMLLAHASWRVLFWLCSAYAAGCTMLAWIALAVTLPLHHRKALGRRQLVTRCVAIAHERLRQPCASRQLRHVCDVRLYRRLAARLYRDVSSHAGAIGHGVRALRRSLRDGVPTE
ncbi:MAG: MFS transporter [Acetobacteraceae bacterium]|nr:MFS transporter [Acetobacteraceae bacterium]MBV8588915.1 MFS transporter [Acetobacteraceae bacterium]